jgi:carboxypeptidase PM20D1
VTGAGAAPFEELRAALEAAFPRAHATLQREPGIPLPALLLTWPGREPVLRPWMILAHQDVVDAIDGPNAGWPYPPFGGAVAEGRVWGRGAIDMKCALVGVLQAIEDQLAEGFVPRRTLFLCCGADEETGGTAGATRIASALRARGTRLAATFDEGGVVLADGFPGITRPLALVGLAQKGEVTLRLHAEGGGGHGALPADRPATTRLLRALGALGEGPLPGRVRGLPALTIAALAEAARPAWRPVYKALTPLDRLSGGLVSRHRSLATLARSTFAITRLAAGMADNVVPSGADATLDIRLVPGDTAAGVAALVQARVAPFGVIVTAGAAIDPSDVGSTQGPAFRCLKRVLHTELPDAAAIPYVAPNDTDSKHFADLADEQIRFLPLHLRAADLNLIHGSGERIEIAAYRRLISFYRRLIAEFDMTNDAPAQGRGP